MITMRDRRKIFGYAVFAAISLVLFGADVQQARGQVSLPLTLGCVWPFKTTPETLNVFYPDANAIYWTTPYVLLPGSRLDIDGSFLPSRFLSFDSYNTLGNSISSIVDVNFPLDSGSENPFSTPSATGGKFHLTIVPPPPGGGTPPPGYLYGPPINQFGFSQGYVVLRSYLPNPAINQRQLPKITISVHGSKLETLRPCTTLQSSLRLLLFNAFVRSWDGKLTAPGQSEPTTPAFRPPPAGTADGAFPNDFNKYIVTGLTYQRGRLALIRGKAPTFPQTNSNGYPITAGENMRYWSLCMYDYVFPYPVVKNGCSADETTALDADNYYTYLIAAKADTPTRQDPDVTLLPWGATQLQKVAMLRNMLPDPSFTPTAQTANTACAKYTDPEQSASCTANAMGPYYPTVTYC